MPQDIASPIASPRSAGYKPGDEVTVGGQTFQVMGTNQDGLPLLAPKASSFQEDAPASQAEGKVEPTMTSRGNALEKVYAKRDRIAALPEGPRALVIDRLFNKLVKPKIPAAMKDDQRTLIKQRFIDHMMGQSPTPGPAGPSEADFKRFGLPTGAGGKVQQGVMGGLGNITSLLDKLSGNNGLQGALNSVTGDKTQLPEQSAATIKLKDAASALGESTSAYEGRHPTKAGISEFLGQALPATATEMLMPGAPPGASLGSKIISGAGKGAAGMVPFDPSVKGVTTGAAFGAGFPLAGKGFNKLKNVLKPAAKIAGPVISKAGEAIPGAAENATESLETLAQKKFQKPLSQLTPDQKIELVSKWRDDSVTAVKAEKVSAKKAAEAAKAAAVTKKATEAIDQKVAVRKAMDESKALQKNLAAFIKQNKRAPNADELAEIKRFIDNNPNSNVTLHGGAKITKTAEAKAAEAKADTERGIKTPQKRTFLRTTNQDVKEYYDYRFGQLRKELTEATSPEEKADAERRLAELTEVQKLHPTSMGDVHDFKVESPEAIKAVSAVADVTKVVNEFKPVAAAEVKVIPEGQHGTGEIGKRAKDAERKAAERAKALREQPEQEAQGTPETALLEKESQYLELMDKLEALGPKGKEAAKNLNQYKRKGLLTMDQVLEMSNKILTDPKYKAKAMGAE